MILSIGADAVAKAPPDGYTILITSVTSSHAANVYNFKKLPYDPIKDFTPVATLHKSYFILMVRANAPWKNGRGADRGDEDKGRQGELRLWRAAGAGFRGALQGPQGFESGRIPYKTSMASLPEMFSGEIDFQFIDSTAGTPLLQGGKVRGLAVTSGQRVPGVDLPTMAEAAGIPEFDIAPVWGVLLPAGAPAPIVARLESWFAQISKMDATRQYLANTHAAPFPAAPRHLAEFIPKEIKKWEELAKLAKIQPQ